MREPSPASGPLGGSSSSSESQGKAPAPGVPYWTQYVKAEGRTWHWQLRLLPGSTVSAAAPALPSPPATSVTETASVEPPQSVVDTVGQSAGPPAQGSAGTPSVPALAGDVPAEPLGPASEDCRLSSSSSSSSDSEVITGSAQEPPLPRVVVRLPVPKRRRRSRQCSREFVSTDSSSSED